MRSLFAKILVWFWATLAITIVGVALISYWTEDEPERRTPFSRMVTFELQEAVHAYQFGGREGLAAFMRRFQTVFEGEGILTDGSGRDLLTGADHADLVARARLRPRFTFERGNAVMVTRSSSDGRHWFFHILRRPDPPSWFLRPQHLWAIGAAVLLCYLLAFHLTTPVRQLQKAVERFGRGDLSARAASDRRDELGQLARTFDQMADRTETLLSAERRLLLDISHELRSPLARLGVAIELARSGDDRDAAVNRIQKEWERLNALVGQLLEITRAEAGVESLRKEPVRLDELVTAIAEDGSIEARARGNSLAVQCLDPLEIQGDPELLRRAVENVLRNAIRYSPESKPVEIRLERRGQSAVVQIRDYGAGVPEEALPRIFDAFYRVDADRNRARGGVGLGLSIARRAIELHKGSIRARNVQPGLEVEIELPLVMPIT
jgi:two-component system sensor histidine kinase CpxA